MTNSATPAGQIVTEPLITADYDMRLDLQNRVQRFWPAIIGLNIGHQAGATATPIKSVSLDYSTDDGAHWKSVPVQRTGTGTGTGKYLAVITQPGKGFVSLRLHATDQAGATLSQQVIRAFAVRPGSRHPWRRPRAASATADRSPFGRRTWPSIWATQRCSGNLPCTPAGSRSPIPAWST